MGMTQKLVIFGHNPGNDKINPVNDKSIFALNL
jgi:hypothetical protein